MERRTFLVGAAAAALSACAKDAVPSATGAPTPLPSPEPGAAVLDHALEGRRAIRTFTAEPVDDDLLAHLLWAAQGQTAPWGGRTAPSAGGLYPLEVYLATDRNLRRYVPDAHRASEVASGDRRGAIADATGGQEAARDDAVATGSGPIVKDRLGVFALGRVTRAIRFERGAAVELPGKLATLLAHVVYASRPHREARALVIVQRRDAPYVGRPRQTSPGAAQRDQAVHLQGTWARRPVSGWRLGISGAWQQGASDAPDPPVANVAVDRLIDGPIPASSRPRGTSTASSCG